MGKEYLAVDLGASSGRVIRGCLKEGKLDLEEICRFPNGMTKRDGHRYWDYDEIFRQICLGLKICKEQGRIPVSMGVDTWGVDFVLLDEQDRLIGQTVGYRDERTDGMDKEVNKLISQKDLYGRTGTLKAIYNTIYQLMALKMQEPEQLAAAHTLLMVPDYFHYLLTGVKSCEYSEATTSGLIDPKTRDWDLELIDLLGYPRRIFRKPVPAGTAIGTLREDLVRSIGFDLTVTAPCSHDTQSAIAALPAEGSDNLYISSGTWSLMGVERAEADCSERSAQLNFTNEGGYGGSVCYLQNIMGLWMIQSVRHEFGDQYGYGEICEMAEACKDFPSRVDAGDERFLNPPSMTEAVQTYCRETGQPVPETLGELATVIYASLAECYARTADLLEEMTGKKYTSIYIVGGGSQADYLNRLTAIASGRRVYAGPSEATAIGNILCQMIRSGEISSLEEGRRIVRASFAIKKYESGGQVL